MIVIEKNKGTIKYSKYLADQSLHNYSLLMVIKELLLQ